MRYEALFLLLFVCAGHAEQIKFVTLKKEKIETRLKMASPKNEERGVIFRQLLTDAGCEPNRIIDQPVKGSKYPNIICTVPGENPETIVVGAHYDFEGDGLGVIDNWSGAALLSSLLESLKAYPMKHTFVLVGFTGEEKGLVGSRAYVKQMNKFEMAHILGMVNLDCVGLGMPNIEMTRGDKLLVNAFNLVAKSMQIRFGLVNVHDVGITDSDSFQDRKIPALSVHSLTQETWRKLHSSSDRLDAIDVESYYQTYRLVAAFLAFLDTLPTHSQPSGGVVTGEGR